MVRKREGEKQIRVHIWLYESDWEEIKAKYSDTYGPSRFIREGVRRILNAIKEKANVGKPRVLDIDIQLGDEHTDGGEHSGEHTGNTTG